LDFTEQMMQRMVINLQFKDKKQSPANNFKTKGKNERENGVIFYV
jgi:hypothetical protein